MNIQFREPLNPLELESLFKLRYAVYSEDEHLHSMIPTSNKKMEINFHDHLALHFAAFHESEPIGYIRMTTDAETKFTPWVSQISKQSGIDYERAKIAFPFQQYYPDSNWSSTFISSLVGRKIGEVGKLAIHKDFRGGLIFTDFIEAFVKYCKKEHFFSTGFGTCSLPLERYYKKFGFIRAEGSVPFTYHNLPEAVIVRFDN